jgi:nitrile hydratase
MHGFGPVVQEPEGFHEPWEGRVYGMNAAITPGLFPNGHAGRYALEVLPPAEYLAASYFERWLLRAERRLVELGTITQEELDARVAFYEAHPEAPVPRGDNPASLKRAMGRFAGRANARPKTESAPRFAVGDPVRTKNIHPRGHTRLPRYARDKPGVIAAVYGSYDLPDTSAHGEGPQIQPIYSVRFEAQKLWGEATEGRQAVYLDLWESYLDPERAPA